METSTLLQSVLEFSALGLLGLFVWRYIKDVERRQSERDASDRQRWKQRDERDWEERKEYIDVIRGISDALCAMTSELKAHEERTDTRFRELIADHQIITTGINGLSKRGINGP